MSGYTPLPDWLTTMPTTTVPLTPFPTDGFTTTAPARFHGPVLAPVGWICPRCGTAHSPYMGTCLSCRPPLRVASGANADAYSY